MRLLIFFFLFYYLVSGFFLNFAQQDLRIDEESHIKSLVYQLKKQPNNVKALFQLGWYMQKRDDIKRALEFYQKCVAINKKYIHAWINIGNIQSQQNLISKAEISYRKALLFAPSNAMAHYNIATFFMKKLKKWEKAQFHFLKTIELQPTYKEAYVNLAAVYLKLYIKSKDNKYLDLAHRILHDVLEYKKDYKVAFYNLAIIAEMNKKKDLALLYYRKAKKLYPINSAPYKKSIHKIQKLSISH